MLEEQVEQKLEREWEGECGAMKEWLGVVRECLRRDVKVRRDSGAVLEMLRRNERGLKGTTESGLL